MFILSLNLTFSSFQKECRLQNQRTKLLLGDSIVNLNISLQILEPLPRRSFVMFSVSVDDGFFQLLRKYPFPQDAFVFFFQNCSRILKHLRHLNLHFSMIWKPHIQWDIAGASTLFTTESCLQSFSELFSVSNVDDKFD